MIVKVLVNSQRGFIYDSIHIVGHVSFELGAEAYADSNGRISTNIGQEMVAQICTPNVEAQGMP